MPGLFFPIPFQLRNHGLFGSSCAERKLLFPKGRSEPSLPTSGTGVLQIHISSDQPTDIFSRGYDVSGAVRCFLQDFAIRDGPVLYIHPFIQQLAISRHRASSGDEEGGRWAWSGHT